MEKYLQNGSGALESVLDRARLYEIAGHDYSLKPYRIAYIASSFDKGVRRTDYYAVTREDGGGKWGLPTELARGKTKEEALQNFAAGLKSGDFSIAPKAKSDYTPIAGVYRWRGQRSQLGWFVQIKGGKGNLAVEENGAVKYFPTAKEAREFVDNQRDLLQGLIDKMRQQPQTRPGERMGRTGQRQRDKDISSQEFSEAFGFRGVEFGNYVEQARRQQDLNDAYDALMDMAGVLGLPPKSLSLNGQLGLAFGARGKGAAAAHYEPSKAVINLTKGNGPGALAHEWMHALDDYFYRIEGDVNAASARVNRYMSGRETRLPDGAKNPATGKEYEYGLRQEMYQAWKDLRVAIAKARDFGEASERTDKARSKSYWSLKHEKAARAFERYMVDKMAEQDKTNGYLVSILEGTKLYPSKDDMEGGISAAFDKLFATMKYRPTAKGIELYSSSTAGGALVGSVAGFEVDEEGIGFDPERLVAGMLAGAITGRAIRKEKRGIFNVQFNGKNSTVIKKDIEAVDKAIKFERGKENPKSGKGFGALHIEKHLDTTKNGWVTTQELLSMGENIRAVDPVDSDGKRVYEYFDDGGVRFRVLVGDTKNGERIISFFSNRKPKKAEGVASAATITSTSARGNIPKTARESNIEKAFKGRE